MLNSSIANFFAILYSAILNIELHCSKYCKKIIIFYYVERRERWERKDIILRYIILMSKRGK